MHALRLKIRSSGPATATVRAYGAVRYDDRTAQVVIPRVGGRVVKRHPATLHPGTEVKAGDPVVDRVAGGDDQYRYRVLLPAPLREQLESGFSGESEVEQDRLVRVGRHGHIGGVAVAPGHQGRADLDHHPLGGGDAAHGVQPSGAFSWAAAATSARRSRTSAKAARKSSVTPSPETPETRNGVLPEASASSASLA